MKYIKMILLPLLVITSVNLLNSYDSFSESHPETETVIGHVAVRAVDVKDKESLKAFVLSAKEHLEKNYETAIHDFKTKEEWRKGPIYLYGVSLEGKSLFYPNDPKIEGSDLLQNPHTRDGAEKALSAVQAGGGFIEYHWDNPAIEGKDYTSKKLSYVTTFQKDGKDYIVGSGIYLTKE